MWVFTLRRASGSAVSCNLRSWGALGLGLLTACQRGGVSETKRSFFSWIISAQLKKGSAWFWFHHTAGGWGAAVVEQMMSAMLGAFRTGGWSRLRRVVFRFCCSMKIRRFEGLAALWGEHLASNTEQTSGEELNVYLQYRINQSICIKYMILLFSLWSFAASFADNHLLITSTFSLF